MDATEMITHTETQLARYLPTVPAHMHEGIREYVMAGRPVGDFLFAVLSDKSLMDVAGRADDENEESLFAWAKFVCNAVPHDAHRSEKNVKEWIKRGGLRGKFGVGLAHELRRPMPTEPATCRKVQKRVGIHVDVEPPKCVTDGGRDRQEAWVGELCQFLHNHRDQSNTFITVKRDEQEQCSACGKEWKLTYSYEDSGMPKGLRCTHCGAGVDLTEPTP